MKLAKRIFAILLLVALTLSMTACAEANILGVSTPTTPLAVSDGSTVSDFEKSVAYRNDYFKYTCELPDDWYVLNQEEIAQLLGYTVDTLGESDAGEIIQDSFESGESKMDFYAVAGDGLQNINIVLGELKVLEMLLPMQQLLDASTKTLVSGLENMGATNVTTSTKTIDFLGEERTALLVTGDYMGTTIYETIVVMRDGMYNSSVTMTSFGQDGAQDMLAYFQTID
ncbi:MAG: hypothetical protein R2912_13095 [Eubacteriales bacterium]